MYAFLRTKISKPSICDKICVLSALASNYQVVRNLVKALRLRRRL